MGLMSGKVRSKTEQFNPVAFLFSAKHLRDRTGLVGLKSV